jgi:hypothetical protein
MVPFALAAALKLEFAAKEAVMVSPTLIPVVDTETDATPLDPVKPEPLATVVPLWVTTKLTFWPEIG